MLSASPCGSTSTLDMTGIFGADIGVSFRPAADGALRGGRPCNPCERTRHRQFHDHPRLELRFGDLRNLVDGGDGAGDGIVAVAEVAGDLHGFAAAVRARQAQTSSTLPRPRSAITDSRRTRSASAAACMDAPRSLTSLTPSSNAMAPANVSAVYSPSGRGGADVDGVDQSLALVGGFHLLESGEGGDVDGRLRHLGGVELLRRAVDAHVQEIVAEDLGRLVEERLRRGALVAELLGHADGPRALPWEEKGVLGRVVRRGDGSGARRARERRT